MQVVLRSATRKEVRETSGAGIVSLFAEFVVDAGDIVDWALAGLGMGKPAILPVLPDGGESKASEVARQEMSLCLSLRSGLLGIPQCNSSFGLFRAL